MRLDNKSQGYLDLADKKAVSGTTQGNKILSRTYSFDTTMSYFLMFKLQQSKSKYSEN